jgi:hypothetical protein
VRPASFFRCCFTFLAAGVFRQLMLKSISTASKGGGKQQPSPISAILFPVPYFSDKIKTDEEIIGWQYNN